MDVWMLDSASQGWEEIVFEKTFHPDGKPDIKLADASCNVNEINKELPKNRAGHTAVSTGLQAIICGGYASKNPSNTIFVGDGQTLECWWFTPTPHARFDKLKLKSSSKKPEARWAHAAAQDPQLGHMLIFGGMSRGTTALQDCWFLQLSTPVDAGAEYEWVSCSPTGATALKPEARYGAGAVFHGSSRSFYVFGGFAWTGTSFEPMNDMWVLHDFEDISKVEWKIVSSVSTQPTARGFHAVWLKGFNIYLHGGQVSSGTGIASVNSETWSYDIYTKVWTRYGSSDAAPTASSLSVGPVSASVAIAFGGVGPDSRPRGDAVVFEPGTGWRHMTPAGARPPRSAGHSAIYDPDAFKMVVSFGLAQGPTLLDDQWTLDLSTRTWSRRFLPAPPPLGPFE